MRTTVNLEADMYDFTSNYAKSKGITLSAAVNELLHRAENARELEAPSDHIVKNEFGYYEIAATGHILTPEMVKAYSEDELV